MSAWTRRAWIAGVAAGALGGLAALWSRGRRRGKKGTMAWTDLFAQGWAANATFQGNCGPWVNSSGVRVMLAYPTESTSGTPEIDPTMLSMIVSSNHGATWAEADGANRPGDLDEYAIWVCRSPLNPDVLCIAHTQIYDDYLWVDEFNIETLTWGSRYGGLIPAEIRFQANLRGLVARSTDLVALIEAHGYTAAFLPITVGGGIGTAINCTPAHPSQLFSETPPYYSARATCYLHGLLVDGEDRCYTVLEVDDELTENGEYRYLYQSTLSALGAVTETLIYTREADRRLGNGSIERHSSGVIFAHYNLYNEDLSDCTILSGYCLDGGTISYSLSSFEGYYGCALFSFEGSVYLFFHSIADGKIYYVIYDPATQTASEIASGAVLLPGWDDDPDRTGNQLTDLRAVSSGRIGAVVYFRWYFEPSAPGLGYATIGRLSSTISLGSGGYASVG